MRDSAKPICKCCIPVVSDDRKQASLKGLLVGVSIQQRTSVEAVSMDMWRPYINAIQVQSSDVGIDFGRFPLLSGF